MPNFPREAESKLIKKDGPRLKPLKLRLRQIFCRFVTTACVSLSEKLGRFPTPPTRRYKLRILRLSNYAVNIFTLTFYALLDVGNVSALDNL